MDKKATNYFEQGYSCSESMIKAAIDNGLAPKELLPAATAFSGGMGSGCLCGAIAGSQMILGAMNGRDDQTSDGKKARELAKKFVEEFKKTHKATCCKVLTSGLDFSSPARKEHCKKIVSECACLVKTILELDKQKV